MLITTSDELGDKRILRTLGLACGSTVRARNVGSDILSGLRGVIGGEVKGYTRLLAESREQAIQRMVEQAEQMGANAIVSMRFATSLVMNGAAELLAYGTAVEVEQLQVQGEDWRIV